MANQRTRIATLSQLADADTGLFGAKATGLARLGRAGFQVPAGVALGFTGAEAPSLDAEERTRILAACRDTLGDDFYPVAVRSSAAEEDGAELSYAGQFETRLRVGSDAELFDAIRACLASASSARVRAYRATTGRENPAFGILIQRMVAARFSGVCFTEDPTDGTHLAIEAVAGTAEELVGGRCSPSRWSFDRENLELVSGPREGGVDRAKLHDLAAQALAAERSFGHPLDIEWAADAEGIQFLQARPLTHARTRQRLARLRAQELERLGAGARGRALIWSDFSIGDVLPNPSPLVMDAFNRAAEDGGGIARAFRALGFAYKRRKNGPPLFEMVCGRAYLNLTEYLDTVRGTLPLTVGRGAASGLKVGFDLRRDLFQTLLAPLSAPVRGVRAVAAFRRARREMERDFTRHVQPRLAAEAAALRAQDLSGLTDAELWDTFERHAARNRNEPTYYHLMTDIVSGVTQQIVRAALGRVYGDKAREMEMELTTGLEGNFNTLTNLALCDVARGELDLGKFLEEFGHRGNPDWDPAAPRWREDREKLLRMAEKLRAGRAEGRARFERQRGRRREFEHRLEMDLDGSLWSRVFKRWILGELRHFQIYSPLRETSQSLCFLWVELTRNVVLEIARRTDAGDLLFQLGMDELRSFCLEPSERPRLLALARERKTDLRLLRTLYLPHILDNSDLGVVGNPPPLPETTDRLTGEPVCQGWVRGRARVIASLEDSQDLEPGEILVTQFTDPSWTPLFLVAGGLVLEQGSSFSHGAIVAREYGLPAIVNVPDATRIVRTGQMVTLNASSGTLYLQSASTESAVS